MTVNWHFSWCRQTIWGQWSTFFSISFCLNSLRTIVKSSLVIFLSPTTSLNLPTHLLRKLLGRSSCSSSSLSRKPATGLYSFSSMYFEGSGGGEADLETLTLDLSSCSRSFWVYFPSHLRSSLITLAFSSFFLVLVLFFFCFRRNLSLGDKLSHS